MVGKRLGHFEILELLGAGGMGEVYQARDTKLDRDVAIKVLPEDFANDADRLARFEREAKLLASLNHSKIAGIYGLEDADGVRFIAMELVEGETLAGKLANIGRLEVDEALDIARQIAEALEAAHENGVVHRDLKPANVIVTQDGQVKVLDFGLAKAFDAGAPREVSPDLSHSPTMAAPTRTGAILGTAAYMSPEQAKGKPVDRRSDVWAFGCVLHEMLAGRQAFRGEDVSEVLASVLRDEPPHDELPGGTPSSIRRLQRRCLQKNPRDRLDSMAAARLEIEDAAQGPTGTREPAGEAARESWRRVAVLGWGSATLLAAFLVWIALQPEPSGRVIRHTIVSAAVEEGISTPYGTNFAISPDGSFFVYASGVDGTPRLYRQSFDSLHATPVPGSEGAHTPFFSPAGDRVGYAGVDGELRIASLRGEAPVPLLEEGAIRGSGYWGQDGYIYFAGNRLDSVLKRIPADGTGTVERLTELDADAGELRHMMPELLPNGAGVLFTIVSGGAFDPELMEIAVLDLSTKEYRGLVRGMTARVTGTDHILVLQADGSVVAYRFDEDQLITTGFPVPLFDGVGVERFGTADLAVSAAGVLMYGTRRGSTSSKELVWVERDGTATPIDLSWNAAFTNLALSPDGGLLAASVVESDSLAEHVWVKDLDSGSVTKVTSTNERNLAQAWTADGAYVIFTSVSGAVGSRGIFRVRADGLEPERLLLSDEAFLGRISFSSRTEWLVYTRGGDIYGLHLPDEPVEPVLLSDTEFAKRDLEVSPDGALLAYASSESGQNQVHLSPFSDPAKSRHTVSVGRYPRFSPDGRELFFVRNGELVVVDAVNGDEPRTENPRRLFSLDNYGSSFAGYDVSPDGRRFIMARYLEDRAGSEVIIVVHNFFEEMVQAIEAGEVIGTTLGPYKIIEQLGAGGMGEVYLGEDTRLGRKVAIKVLPAEFASDPERLARFEQEARAAAALNHPHIAVVHDIGTEGDTHFMVQEYLEGQSLRERLDKGALPLDKALDLATEVGEALIAAHKAGIIHRDLKPDNIFVTEEGHAKVLDFGLAKLTEMAAPVGSELSMSPTMLGTVAGQVMGTAGYMSPEQVQGEEVDHRADLFAFGCVLYEMVTGRRAFAGDNVHETLSRIISRQPEPVHEARRDLPLKLGWIIDKSLAKDVSRRYQTAGDLGADLSQLSEEVVAGVATSVPVHPSEPVADPSPTGMSIKLVAPLTVAVAALAALATFLTIRPSAPAAGPPLRFEIELPEGTYLPAGVGNDLAISPDGMTLAFVAQGEDGKRLYLRRLDEFETIPVPGTDGAANPFFSPDGDWIGFEQGAGMSKISIDGFEPFPLCELCGFASWGDDGNIYFGWNNTVWRIPDVGGGERQLVADQSIDDRVNMVWRGTALPGSEALAFESGGVNGGVGVLSLERNEIVWLADDAVDPFYSASGHILFGRGSALFAAPFDIEAFRASRVGDALQGVRIENGGATQAAISDTGTLVYAPASASAGTQLAWVDAEENVEFVSDARMRFFQPRLSPGAQQIAVAINDRGSTDIWTVDVGSGALNQITNIGDALGPIWTPSGEQVTFGSGSAGSFAIQSMRADGAGDPVTLLESEHQVFPDAWHSDGDLLIYREISTNSDILVWSVAEGSRTALLNSPFNEYAAVLSPDETALAYVSERTGSLKVYTTPFPGPGGEIPVSLGTGFAPMWSPVDNRLFFREGRLATFMAATVVEGAATDHAPLFDGTQIWWDLWWQNFDVHPDGDRFLGLHMSADDEHPKINVVLNWFEELKERVPTGRQ